MVAAIVALTGVSTTAADATEAPEACRPTVDDASVGVQVGLLRVRVVLAAVGGPLPVSGTPSPSTIMVGLVNGAPVELVDASPQTDVTGTPPPSPPPVAARGITDAGGMAVFTVPAGEYLAVVPKSDSLASLDGFPVVGTSLPSGEPVLGWARVMVQDNAYNEVDVAVPVAAP